MHQFRVIIVLGEVSQQEVRHMRRPVRAEKFQRLRIREVPVPAADAVLQEVGITPLFQHHFIVIGFQEGGMALFEVVDELIAGYADVSKDPDVNPVGAHHETMRLDRVVKFREGGDLQIPDRHRLKGGEPAHQRFVNVQSSVLHGAGGDVDRQLMFADHHGNAPDMINMFMRYKNGAHLAHTQPQPGHALLRFPARNARVHQDGVRIVADIITVSVAAGVQGSNVK